MGKYSMETVELLREQLRVHEQNLVKLELQAARHGMDVPLPLQNQIDFETQKIEELRSRLSEAEAGLVVGEDALGVVAEKPVPLWRKVPVWGWVGIVGVVLLAVAVLAFWAIWRPKRGPAVVLKTATPTPTSIAIPQPTATPVAPTFTPLPPTDTPVPPTATPVPTSTTQPSATPVPPTDTPVPPTPTPVPVQPSPTPECVTAYARSVVLFKPGSPIYTEAPIQNLLGPPQEGHWTTVSGSVGHNGSVVVDFGGRLIQDGPGPDLIFWFGGYPYPDEPEIIEGFRIEGSLDGQSFELIAEVPPKSKILAPVPLTPGEVDLQGKGNLRYLRITDTGTDPEIGSGLELNAIEATCTTTGE